LRHAFVDLDGFATKIKGIDDRKDDCLLAILSHVTITRQILLEPLDSNERRSLLPDLDQTETLDYTF